MSTLDKERLEAIAESLNKVDDGTKKELYDAAKSMSDMEVISLFNQKARDLFDIVVDIVNRYGNESKYNIKGYKNLFENAMKLRAGLPIDQFSMLILEYAAEIYGENEEFFMNLEVPDTNVTVDNEFAFIRSEVFKELWKKLGKDDRHKFKINIIELTTYAHIYLYQIVMKICNK